MNPQIDSPRITEMENINPVYLHNSQQLDEKLSLLCFSSFEGTYMCSRQKDKQTCKKCRTFVAMIDHRLKEI